MRYLFTICLAAMMAISFTSCLEETCEDTVILQGFSAEVVTPDDWRNSIFFCGVGLPVCEATGFYVYEQYLFMVENGEGLHIIDNSDPHNPISVTFMEVPGGQGLAVRNNILYMNQYTDLVAFDLSDPTTPAFINRTNDVFEPGSVFANVLGNDRFVRTWTANGEQRVVDCNSPNFNRTGFFEGDRAWGVNADFLGNAASSNAAFDGANRGETVGVGGSLARFTISKGTLYAVDNSRLKTFSLANEREPEYVKDIELGWGIETIFPTADKLFIGANNGMHIYGIDDPLNPEHLSTFEHVLGCDPVVVDGDLAYITLWGGRDCGTVGDQLEIVDISDARNPVSLQINPMRSSHGLSVAEGKLFLCNQWEGFKTFDLTDDGLLGEVLDSTDIINARDVIVIPRQKNAIVLGYNSDGIQQFDYSDDGQLTPTSRISVCQ